MYDIDLENLRANRIEELISEIKPKLGKRVKDHVEFGRFPYTYAYDFNLEVIQGIVLENNMEKILKVLQKILYQEHLVIC